MHRSSQKIPLPILVIGSFPNELIGHLASQNRCFIRAASLKEGVSTLKFGSFVTILCDWDAIRNVPCNASTCQIFGDINRLGLPILIHSPMLAVGLRFQHWNGFNFYHFRTDLISQMLPKLERLALQVAIQSYPQSLAATSTKFASFDPESGWSLADAAYRSGACRDSSSSVDNSKVTPPAPHFRIGDADSLPNHADATASIDSM